MERKLVLKNDVKMALKSLGVTEGQSIMAHTSLSSLGFVLGGVRFIKYFRRRLSDWQTV